MITEEDFSEIWSTYYGPQLAQVIKDHGSEQDARTVEQIKQHLLDSGVFSNGQTETAVDARAVRAVRLSLRADEEALTSLSMRIASVATPDTTIVMSRLYHGIMAMLDTAIASGSYAIAAHHRVPLPNVA